MNEQNMVAMRLRHIILAKFQTQLPPQATVHTRHQEVILHQAGVYYYNSIQARCQVRSGVQLPIT